MPLFLPTRFKVVLLTLGLLACVPAAAVAQDRSNTYPETRKLLSEMDRFSANAALRELFETGDLRTEDLIAALDDEQQISVNSQVIINYLAVPETLTLLDKWFKRQKESGKEYWIPKMGLLAEPKILSGDESDLRSLAMKNKDVFAASRFNSGDVSVKVLAHNKRIKAALLEVVQGEILTAGWHSVIKLENNKWRLISDNGVWVT